jgi:hypothetical protein
MCLNLMPCASIFVVRFLTTTPAIRFYRHHIESDELFK